MTQCYLRQILLFNTRIKLGRCSVVQSRCGQNIVKPHTYMPRLLKTRYTVVWYKCAQNSSSWQFHTIFHLPLCHFRLLGPWYLLSSDRGTPAGIKITKPNNTWHLTALRWSPLQAFHLARALEPSAQKSSLTLVSALPSSTLPGPLMPAFLGTWHSNSTGNTDWCIKCALKCIFVLLSVVRKSSEEGMYIWLLRGRNLRKK